MDSIERKKNRRTIRIIRALRQVGNIIFFSLVGLLILYFAINTIDINTGYSFAPFGLRNSVIVSESMAYRNPNNTYLNEDMKQIQKNDLIITYRYRSYEDIKIYDVMTYKSGDVLICHRVVNKYSEKGKNYIVTRGDSNANDDTPVEFSNVKGKVIGVIPGDGVVIGFIQSPYAALAIFGSLFFFFGAWFLISYGSYAKYDKVIGREKSLEEDKTYVLNGEQYDQAKKKKDYQLIGGDNHYRVKVKGDELVLERYIRTDYKNKTDNIIVSGTFEGKELNETLILSVLPLAFDLIMDGYNPLKGIKKDLKSKGIVGKDIAQYKKINDVVFSVIKESNYMLDINKIDEQQYHAIMKSYKSFTRYLTRNHMNVEEAYIPYSYVYYCAANNIDPMELFNNKEVAYA